MMRRESVRDVLADAAAVTVVGVLFLVLIAVGIGVFAGSLYAIGAVLDPVVPDGWPSLIILALAVTPTIFYAALAGTLVDRWAEDADDQTAK